MVPHRSVKFRVLCGMMVWLLASSSYCGSTARITKTDNTIVAGKIMPSDNQNVYVQYYGRQTIVPRSEIKEVVHPGIGLMRAGSIVFGSGLVFVGIGFMLRSDDNKSSNYAENTGARLVGGAAIVGGGIASGVGLIFLLSGYYSYSTSNANFETGGLTFWSPGPGVYLGYQPVILKATTPSMENETIHHGKVSVRF